MEIPPETLPVLLSGGCVEWNNCATGVDGPDNGRAGSCLPRVGSGEGARRPEFDFRRRCSVPKFPETPKRKLSDTAQAYMTPERAGGSAVSAPPSFALSSLERRAAAAY